MTYYSLGRWIVETQQMGEKRAKYGSKVIKTLSEKLQKEFGKGFSEDTLKNARKFYLTYKERISETVFSLFAIEKSETVFSLFEKEPPFIVSWSHYLQLMRIENEAERSFYEIESAKTGWGVRTLQRQYNSSLYERLALSRDKEGVLRLATEGNVIAKPEDIIKQPIIGCKNPTGWYVLHGKVQEDSEGKFILVVDLVSDVVGKKFSQDTEMTQLLIDTEFLDDPEGLIEEIWGSGDEYYLLYNNKKQSGVVCNQTLLKMLSALEKTQSKNYLTLETASEISWTQYDEITDMMLLQGAALEEVGKRYFCDFDSQVYYRLIHNLLWSEIDKAKMGSYLKIFMHHQKLKFSEINRDEKFMRKDVNTLYVPKDGRESDSVLTSIYETYLKAKSVRESNDMYNYMLELKEDGFYYNDNRINNIVFLCDNFECGSATIRMLKAYLNLDVTDESEKRKVEQVRANRQKYFIKQNGSDVAPEQRDEVPLESVIKKNNCTIEIHGYYGTEIGKKAVEDFLNEQHINSGVVSYERQITKQATQIINEVKEIWPRFAPKENVYTVVREFNMPKMNVFPVTMLNDPKRAICMFVKKDEIKKRQK